MADPVLTPEQIAEQEAFARNYKANTMRSAATPPQPTPQQTGLMSRFLRKYTDRNVKAGGTDY